MTWRWDVALSFAGAQRAYVEQVAQSLVRRGLRCFYDADRLTRIELWGTHLTESLPLVYGEQAAVVVIFISADYAARDWTILERRAALARAVRERREYILPARFDNTRLPGLLSDMVAIDLNDYAPEQFAEIVASKLESLGISPLVGDESEEPSGQLETHGSLSLSSAAWRAHWDPRARGVENAARKGWYFTGRSRALAEIRDWLTGSSPVADSLRVVTGGPGSGKSAVLARVVTLSNADYRATMPEPQAEDDPLAGLPTGIVDVAAHARAMSVAAVLDMIASAVSFETSLATPIDETVDSIVRILLYRKRRLVAVVDALDESADPRRLASSLYRIALEAGESGLKLIIGTRPGGPGHRYLSILGTDMNSDNVIDLDSSTYLARNDLTEYIRRRLLQNSESSSGQDSPYRGREDLAERVAVALADAAYPSFLIGQLCTAGLVRSRLPLGPDDAQLRDFPRDVSAAMDRYLIGLGDEQERVEDLLRPLAYARGDGLPHDDHDIWPRLANSLARFGKRYDIGDVSDILDSAEDYLIETVVDGKSIYYRLYHQALADLLRSLRRNPARQASAPHLIYRTLVDSVPRDSQGNRDWSGAHPYLLEHLPGHAADANLLLALLRDVGFLVWAEPAGIFAALQQSSDAQGSRTAQIYRAGYHTFPDGSGNAGWRAAQLHLIARRHRDPLASDIERNPTPRPWTTRWTTGRLLSPHYIVGRHRGPVLAVTTGRIDDRTVILTCGQDRIARSWDLVTGLSAGTMLNSRRDWLAAIAVGTARGKRVAVTGGDDGTVRLWDLATGQPVGAPLAGHVGPVNAVATGELDGRPVAVSGGDDDTVRVWDLTAGEPLYPPLRGHTNAVTCVAVGQLDRSQIAVTGSRDDSIRAWDLAKGRSLGSPLLGHVGSVTSLELASIDMRPAVVTGGQDRTIRVWDLRSVLRAEDVAIGHLDLVSGVATGYLAGRPIAMSASWDLTVRVWDMQNGEEIGSPLVGHRKWVTCIASGTLEGRLIAVTGSYDDTVRIWDVESGSSIGKPLAGHINTITAVAVGEYSGNTYAVSSSWDETVRVWNLSDRTEVGTPLAAHSSWVAALAIAEIDGRAIFVTGSHDQTARVWGLTSGEPVGPLLVGHEGAVSAVAVGYLGERAFVATGSHDTTVRFWDPWSGHAEFPPLAGHTGAVVALAVGQLDETVVVVTGSSDHTVCVWDIRNSLLPISRIVLDAPVSSLCLDRNVLVITVGPDVICVDLPEGQVEAAWPADRR